MKTKKLIAILTIVALMMTLVPMAAFGAASRFTSSMTIDKTEITADGTDQAIVTVYVADGGNPAVDEWVYIATDRGIETIEQYNTTTPVSALKTDSTGIVRFQVKSNVAGTSRMAVGLNTSAADVQNYLRGVAGNTANTAGLIGEVQTLTFAAASADSIVLVPAAPVAADGFTKMSVTARVYAGTTPVSGQTVTFYADKAGLTFDKTSYTTDVFGYVTAKVTSTKGGTFAITAKTGSKIDTENYTFTALGQAYSIETKLVPTGAMAVGYESEKVIKLAVTDLNGNLITNAGRVSVTSVAAPSGGAHGVNYNSADANGYLQYDVKPTKEGTYTVRFSSLDTNKYVDVTFEAKRQGDITQLMLIYLEPALQISASGNVSQLLNPIVRRIDANGVWQNVVLADGSIKFSSSDVSLATVNSTTGIVTTATKNIADAGKSVTITAVDHGNNLVATAPINLVGQPIGFKVTGETAVEVDKATALTIQFVDASGVNAKVGNWTGFDLEYTILTAPADAGVSVTYAGDAATTLPLNGKTSVSISSTKAGDVTVQLRIKDKSTNNYYITPVTVKVGAVKQAIGAKSVIMFIGAKAYTEDNAAKMTDVAPFIKDSRTFVAVRPVAEAFAAEIAWNEATQTVTLTRADVTVTIVIGSNTISVVRDGVTSTITADVPAFIVDGRTVLPFRAVGEAFGATVNYDATTQSVSFVQE